MYPHNSTSTLLTAKECYEQVTHDNPQSRHHSTCTLIDTVTDLRMTNQMKGSEDGSRVSWAGSSAITDADAGWLERESQAMWRAMWQKLRVRRNADEHIWWRFHRAQPAVGCDDPATGGGVFSVIWAAALSLKSGACPFAHLGCSLHANSASFTSSRNSGP